MLAKLTSRNQITIPKKIMDQIPEARYFEVELRDGVEVLPYVKLAKVRSGPVLIASDPSDDMFLRSAVTAGAKYIISGDRHLLQLKSYKRIPILSPTEFLTIEGNCGSDMAEN
jgi:predicted nucleic acid-binding protein